jgi:hypothetical protein
VCLSIAAFTVQTLSQTRSSNRAVRSPDPQRGARPKIDREQKQDELQKSIAKRRKEFLWEKYALKPTDQQWSLIKPKLERVQHLRLRVCSTAGLLLTSSSGSGAGARPIEPRFQWRINWKDQAPAELTEAQRNANVLMELVDKHGTTAEEFKRAVDALRVSRSRQAQLGKELSEARDDLRKVLTTRQEAALVLMGWL